MKNIQLLLLMILTQTAVVLSAQESKLGYDSDSESVQGFKQRGVRNDGFQTHVFTLLNPEQENELDNSSESFDVFREGLNLLENQGQDTENLEMDNNPGEHFTHNKRDFSTRAGSVEDMVAQQMKYPFLRSLYGLIDSSSHVHDISIQIQEMNDPILQFVMDHKDGQLKPIIRTWVNSQNSLGETLLHKVVQDNNKNGAELLISLGINLNIQDINGCTAMCKAFISDNIDMMMLLYHNHADPTIIDDNGKFYSLHVDPKNDLIKIIRNQYCEEKFDELYEMYQKNLDVRSAIAHGDLGATIRLIQQGADVDFLPQQAAIKDIIESHNVHNGDNALDCNVALACKLNLDPRMIKTLLEYGARPNKRFSKGNYTALNYAIENLNFDHLKMLLEYHANPNVINDDLYETPLYMMLDLHYNDDHENDQEQINQVDVRKEMIKLLLEKGAFKSLTMSNMNYITPLVYVVEHNHIDLLQLFLQYNPDVNYIDPESNDDDEFSGDTLLHIASKNNYIEIAQLLLAQSDIDKSTFNIYGETAFDVATTDEMRALLLQY